MIYKLVGQFIYQGNPVYPFKHWLKKKEQIIMTKIITGIKTNKPKAFNFDSAVKTIENTSENLAQLIHVAGLYAIKQANEFNQISFATRLIAAMGTKHDTKRVILWLCAFGKLKAVKGNQVIYLNRKDITSETIDSWQAKAEDISYWEYSKQPDASVSLDFNAMIASIIKRKDKAIESHGIENVTIKNENSLNALMKLADALGINYTNNKAVSVPVTKTV